MSRWIARHKIQIFAGGDCFSVNINLYRAIAQHGYSGVQKGNTVILVSLACVLYGELDVTINRAKILVESLVSVSLKHTLESSTYLRHQQGVTGEVDKPCSSMLAMTRSLTTVLIGNPTGNYIVAGSTSPDKWNVSISQHKFQQVYRWFFTSLHFTSFCSYILKLQC